MDDDFFFDDDDFDEPPAERRSSSRGREPAPKRSSGRGGSGGSRPKLPRPGGGGGGIGGAAGSVERRRQLFLLGASVVVFAIMLLAIRGCLDARKERAFKNYISDLSAITAESDQLSESFFEKLSGGADGDGETVLTNEVSGDRGTAQGLYDRAVGLDAPDELSGAQNEVALAFELRRDGIEEISAALPEVLGNANTRRAIRRVARQMEVFLSSDVLYGRAQSEIEAELENQEIVVDGGVPDSTFLPTGDNAAIDFLDEDAVALLLSGATGGGGGGNGETAEDPNDGLRHGLGLISTTLGPSGVVLVDGGSATAGAGDNQLQIEIQNQGEAAESEIEVSISGDFKGKQPLATIEPGANEIVGIPLSPAPAAGTTATFTVDVATVPGEQVAENNTATYTVTFP